MASQEASMVPHNSIPSREDSANSTISQASSQAVRHSARLRASQASQSDRVISQVASKVSLASGASSQAVRHSSRLRDSQASQADSAPPQANSTGSQGSNTRANNPHSSSMEEPNPKWVTNLSSKPLTQAQRSVLAKGPNFVVSPGILQT